MSRGLAAPPFGPTAAAARSWRTSS